MSQDIEQLYKGKLIAALESAIGQGEMSTVKIIVGTSGVSLTKDQFYKAVKTAAMAGHQPIVEYAIKNEVNLRAPISDDITRLCMHWISSGAYELRWNNQECPYRSLQNLLMSMTSSSTADLAEHFSKHVVSASSDEADDQSDVQSSKFLKPTPLDSGKKTTVHGNNKTLVTTASSSS